MMSQNAVGCRGTSTVGSPAELLLPPELRELSDESSVPDPAECDGVHFLARLGKQAGCIGKEKKKGTEGGDKGAAEKVRGRNRRAQEPQ